MEENKQSNNSFILGTIVFAGIITLLFCIFSVLWTNYDNYNHIPQKSAETYQDELKRISKSLNEETDWESLKDTQRDSVIKVVRTSQLLLLHQQENLINDFRQEMNNNINKVNTWLAFAVGLLSVLGVFVPLVLQYRIQNQEEEKFRLLDNQVKNDISNKIADYVSQTKETQETLENKVNDKINNINKLTAKLDIQEEKLQKIIELSTLTAHFYAFHLGVENNLLQQHPNREDLFRRIWNKSLEAFSNICEACKGNKVSENSQFTDKNNKDNNSEVKVCDSPQIKVWDTLHEKRIFLIEGLIKLHGMITIRSNMSGDRRYRVLDNVYTQINDLLTKLTNTSDTKEAWENIESCLKKLLEAMNELDSCVDLIK